MSRSEHEHARQPAQEHRPGPLGDALRDAVGTAAMSIDPQVMSAYCRDQALTVPAGSPAAVVFPSSTGEVQAVMRVAAQHRVPVVTRGAGSGLSGGANAVDGCVVLCTTRMNRILDVDVRNRLAVVEPGVVNADLSRAVDAVGLCYPPDPSSWEMSTIGGNLATNAGGLCCVKYGVTREWCLGLDVVLADGSLLRTGRRSPKGVAGYDLTALFVGSEGTLGVISQATLRLRPRTGEPTTVVASFACLEDAGRAVTEITGRCVPSLLEIMDRATVGAIESWRASGLDTAQAALLVAQSDAGNEEVRAIAAACAAAGATLVVEASTPEETRMLVGLRRMALPALERQGTVLLDDVAVPVGRIAELLARIEQLAVRHDTLVATFGHAGDGNMHPTLVFDGASAAARERALACFDAIVAAALDLGGTVTGEHGVGRLKRPHLARELGPTAMATHRAVKAALDPLGILNPGAIFDAPTPAGLSAPATRPSRTRSAPRPAAGTQFP